MSFFWRVCLQADEGELRESLSLHLLLLKDLWLKTVRVLKWHILGWHVLNSCSSFGWPILLLFSLPSAGPVLAYIGGSTGGHRTDCLCAESLALGGHPLEQTPLCAGTRDSARGAGWISLLRSHSTHCKAPALPVSQPVPTALGSLSYTPILVLGSPIFLVGKKLHSPLRIMLAVQPSPSHLGVQERRTGLCSPIFFTTRALLISFFL